MDMGKGQGSLACCSPWGCKESDTTEWLNSSNKQCRERRSMGWWWWEGTRTEGRVGWPGDPPPSARLGWVQLDSPIRSKDSLGFVDKALQEKPQREQQWMPPEGTSCAAVPWFCWLVSEPWARLCSLVCPTVPEAHYASRNLVQKWVSGLGDKARARLPVSACFGGALG